MNKLFLLLVVYMLFQADLYAQNCPENIGFENGNFGNWKIFTGTATLNNNKNSIATNEINAPINTRHTIISNHTDKDIYGGFDLLPKNGGSYAVKLGNNGSGAQVDGVSYLLTVPADRPEFTLTYQYAVVLEDPSHPQEEQPRFIARVKDIETNTYIPCASFEYVATSSLPGFKKSLIDNSIIYKDWTPVTINLSGYQGKQLLIEFISADCALGGHFGYAYVDVNNVCGDLIVGNTYCQSTEELNISGPSGFQFYNWYNADRSVKYGSGQNISIKPSLPEGSKLVLDLIPYQGFGCPSSITTIIHRLDYQVQVAENKVACEDSMLDLTASEFILNKNSDFTYLIFLDSDLTKPVNGRIKISKDSKFYIKATNFKGCESYATIDIKVSKFSDIEIKTPPSVCYNEVVDITSDGLYLKTGGMERNYFSDAAATIKINNANAINHAGKYYVKFINSLGCSKVLPIVVSINEAPVLSIKNPAPVCFPAHVDITDEKIFQTIDQSFKYSFFEDALLKNPVAEPKNVSRSGTYYVMATNASGCTVQNKIEVVINPLPILNISDPLPVCFPEKVDLSNIKLYAGSSDGLTYTFYTDQELSNKIANPKEIGKTGTYYVKATTSSGCFVSDKINVTINKLPTIVLNKPKSIFDNSFIDLTSPEIIKGSSNYTKVGYYNDAMLTRPIANPAKVNKAGTYYISLTNEFGCSISASIDLDVLPQPKIIVPTAFTPQKETNNRLYPFLVSVNKLTSFKIFNKWGVLVYQTSEQTAGWDGQFKSKMQPLETFSWFAEGIDSFGGKVQSTGKTILIL